jgi:hypothetical protein
MMDDADGEPRKHSEDAEVTVLPVARRRCDAGGQTAAAAETEAGGESGADLAFRLIASVAVAVDLISALSWCQLSRCPSSGEQSK